MAQMQQLLDTQKLIEDSLMQRMTDFETKLAASTSPIADLTLGKLHDEFIAFKTLVKNLFSLLKQQVSELALSVDSLEMRSRRKVLLLNGVNEQPEEDLQSVVSKFLQTKLSIVDATQDITVCYRLGTKRDDHCRPILMRFKSMAAKSIAWQKKASLKGTGFVLSEFLTRPRQALFAAARAHFGVKQCWTLDGCIYIKLPSGDRVKVSTQAHLNTLIDKFPVPKNVADDGAAREPRKVKHASTSVSSQSAAASAVATDKRTVTRKQVQAGLHLKSK